MRFPPALYTLDLAQRALALVRPILEDLVEARRLWEEALDRFALPPRQDWWDRADPQVEELSRTYERLEGFRRELESLGLCVLGEKRGEVGFPARLEGRLVLLSWRLGERGIQGWRPFRLSLGEKGPWYPLSESPACTAWIQDDWAGPGEEFPGDQDLPLL